MKLRFQKVRPDLELPDGRVLPVIPSYGRPGDAGLDLTAMTMVGAPGDPDLVKMDFGVAVEIPEGHVGLIFPRSSIFTKDLEQTNSVGVIDSGYRGEISIIFRKTRPPGWAGGHRLYDVGDRVAQMVVVPIPVMEPEWADELSDAERGVRGFGSTGVSSAGSRADTAGV